MSKSTAFLEKLSFEMTESDETDYSGLVSVKIFKGNGSSKKKLFAKLLDLSSDLKLLKLCEAMFFVF